MITAENDLLFLQAGVEVLQTYLLSDVLYWPAGISSPSDGTKFPPITLGNLLLARTRLFGWSLHAEAHHRYSGLCEQMDACRKHWRSAWGRKATRSFHARLIQWQEFLNEYRAKGIEFAGSYASEVRVRVLLNLLQPELETPDREELALLAVMDKTLRAVFIPGPFTWEPELAHVFPVTTYWYLYGGLRK